MTFSEAILIADSLKRGRKSELSPFLIVTQWSILEKEFIQKKVSLIMRQRRLRARKFPFNFPMVHIAIHFVQFQGISNPLFPHKMKKKPDQTIITLLGFSIVFLEKNTPKVKHKHTNKTWTSFLQTTSTCQKSRSSCFEEHRKIHSKPWQTSKMELFAKIFSAESW